MLKAIWIALGVVTAVAAVWLAGYAAFNSDGSAPGTGTGVRTTVTTSP